MTQKPNQGNTGNSKYCKSKILTGSPNPKSNQVQIWYDIYVPTDASLKDISSALKKSEYPS